MLVCSLRLGEQTSAYRAELWENRHLNAGVLITVAGPDGSSHARAASDRSSITTLGSRKRTAETPTSGAIWRLIILGGVA